jgi:hypothetical protein
VQLAQRSAVEPGGEDRLAESSTACASRTASSCGTTSFLMRASFSSRGIAFSTVCRSARMSSVLMVSMSSCGRDLAVDVHDVAVGEHPDHLADRVALADVGEELVAEPLPPRERPCTMPAMSTNDTVPG